MISLKTLKDSIVRPQQTLLREFVCDGCGRSVKETEMVIPIGPRKGEKIIAKLGCKCEDIKLAKRALELSKKSRLDKLQRIFNDNSLINQSLKSATFKNYHPTSEELGNAKRKLMKYVKEFDKNKSHNLLLVGNYGTGKSHLAVAITKELINAGYSCLFLSVPKLLTKIKQSFDGNTKFKEADILELIESVDLFVLDDLGTEYTNQHRDNDNWTHTKLFEVLDNRSGKPTIFTTNLSSKELEMKVNTRNLSRILDGTEVIEMNGTDYRRRRFKE